MSDPSNVTKEDLAVERRWGQFGDGAMGVAHEFRSPLQTLSYGFDFLREACEDGSHMLAVARRLVEAARPFPALHALVEDWDREAQEVDLDSLEGEVGRALGRSAGALEVLVAQVDAMRAYLAPARRTPEVVDLPALVDGSLLVSRNEWKYDVAIQHEKSVVPPVQVWSDRLRHGLVVLWTNLGRRARREREGEPSTARRAIVIRWETGESTVRMHVQGEAWPGPALSDAERAEVESTVLEQGLVGWKWQESGDGRFQAELCVEAGAVSPMSPAPAGEESGR